MLSGIRLNGRHTLVEQMKQSSAPITFVFLVLSAANTKTPCVTHWTCHSAKCIGVINKINDHFLIFR